MIEKFSSERNIKIMGTLYAGVDDYLKKQHFRELYEVYHQFTDNLRFKAPDISTKIVISLTDVGLSLKELNQIEAYIGTEDTLRMMSLMIEIVKRTWG